MIITMRNLHSHHQGDLAESWHVQIFLQHFCWIFSIWHPGEYLLISRWIFACPGEFQEIYLASSSHFQDCEMKWASWTYDGYSVSVKHVCSFDALNECYRSNTCIYFFWICDSCFPGCIQGLKGSLLFLAPIVKNVETGEKFCLLYFVEAQLIDCWHTQ